MTELTTPQQQAEVDALRAQRYETTRATVPELEELLHTPIPILDHGFVRVVDYMGGDGAVVQAARVSYGRGTQTRSSDRTLIRYLMRLGHYEELLNEDPNGYPTDPSRDGLARELARMNLSLNFYTQWYWKIDLHNLLHFLQLRAGAHAQYEIRVYAEAILERVVKPWTPLVHEAFLDYRLGAQTLSRRALQVMRALVIGRRGEAEEMWEESGTSPRERREILETLGLGE